MIIEISKKDILWSYVAKFFQVSSGVIILPLVLRLLTAEEIGMNYLMLTVGTLVALLDFGFAPQFGRNFTYVNSGAQRLLRTGVEYSSNSQINYHLLSVLLKTAQVVYRRLSIFCVVVLLTLGSYYIYNVTNRFCSVKHAFSIWIVFSSGTFFNIYFTYYNSLLSGSGKIAEENKAQIYSKITYLLISIILLLLHCGLYSIVIANFIAPFIQRWYCRRVYFTPELNKLLDYVIDTQEIKETFNIIWYNAKKLGVNFLGGYCISKSSMFIVGLYLSLHEVASFGLLLQLVGALSGVAQTMFNAYQPLFSNFRVTNQIIRFKKMTAFTIYIYWIIMILGGLAITFVLPNGLKIIHSNVCLPTSVIVILYIIAQILEGNHSMFATLIVTNNEVPFVKASLLAGFAIIVLTLVSLQLTSFGLLGVVVIPLIVQLSYSNWRWPLWVLNDLSMSNQEFLYLGVHEIKNRLQKITKK